MNIKYEPVKVCFLGRGIVNPGLQAIWNGERSRRESLNITDRLTPPNSPGI